MGMTVSNSGRQLDELYLSPKIVTYASSVLSQKNNPNAIPREKIIKMLKLENEYRLSAKWLALMEDECQNKEYPMKTIDLLQREVVKESGFNETDQAIDNAIEYLRSAVALYPNDDEILSAANYLKFNKMKPLKYGMWGNKFIDCQLYKQKLSDLLTCVSDEVLYHFVISVSVT